MGRFRCGLILLALNLSATTAGASDEFRASACKSFMQRLGSLAPGTLDAVRVSPCIEQNLQMIIGAERLLDAYRAQTGDPPAADASAVEPAFSAAQRIMMIKGIDVAALDHRALELRIGRRAGAASEDRRKELATERAIVASRIAMIGGEREIALALLAEFALQLETTSNPLNRFLDRITVDEVREIEAILKGKQTPTSFPPIAAPRSPWLRYDIQWVQCAGSSRWPERDFAGDQPSDIDAFIAVGEPDHAMALYLQRHWVDSIGELELPERLREVAEQVYGRAGATAEFEAALHSLEVRNEFLGQSLWIHLFGHWLPLPVSVPWSEGSDEFDEDDPSGPDEFPTQWPGRPFTVSVNKVADMLRRDWEHQDINSKIGFFEFKLESCSPELDKPRYRSQLDRLTRRFKRSMVVEPGYRVDESCPRPSFVR